MNVKVERLKEKEDFLALDESQLVLRTIKTVRAGIYWLAIW